VEKATLSWNTTLTEARWSEIHTAARANCEKKILQPTLVVDNAVGKVSQLIKGPKSVNIKHLYRIWTQEKAVGAPVTSVTPVAPLKKPKEEAQVSQFKHKPPWQTSTNPNSAISNAFSYQPKLAEDKESPKVRISSAKPAQHRLSMSRNKSEFITPYLAVPKREPRQSLQSPIFPVTTLPKKQNFVIKKIHTVELVFSPMPAIGSLPTNPVPRLSRVNSENLRLFMPN
jgi:hypothetical protein